MSTYRNYSATINKLIIQLLRLNISGEGIRKEELIKERTPSELWDWLIQKVNQICSTKEGLEEFRLQKKHLKQLVEEITPLALFGKHKFSNTDQILLKPVIGNQPYDAVVTDLRNDQHSQSYIEITQSHEGENNYWRRRQLLEKGYVSLYAPVVKTGTKKDQVVSIPPEANSVEQRVKNVLERILVAAKNKEKKNYPANTALIISFDDNPPFQEVMDNEKLDSFVNRNILNLDLRFSMLYLVGRDFFREFNLNKKT